MTNPNYTHIAIVLDRSGSMYAVKDDTEGGLRAFLADQADNDDRTTVSLYQFDTAYEPVYEMVDIRDVPDYTLEPRSSTALLDAVGRTITSTGATLAKMPQRERPGTVVMVILTDGQENASREWTLPKVKNAITHQRETYGWVFVFLGADQDAFAAGGSMGISTDTTLSYSSEHTRETFASTSGLITRGRTGAGFAYTEAERDQTS